MKIKLATRLLKHLLFSVLFIFALVIEIASPAFADVWDNLPSFKEEYKINEGVEDYVWKEGTTVLPNYPLEDDLLEVEGPAAYRNYQYLIDGKNLQIGEDRVVRYSIVIRSPSGADNVMYEGLRCSTAEVKNYAYGSTNMDGKKIFFAKSKPVWKPVTSSGVTGYTDSLRRNYFCSFEGMVLTRHEILQNIKYGKGPVDGMYN